MLPFVGPSYNLTTRQASAQRSVNLYLQQMETPSKAGVIMRAVPGLVLFASLGAEIRGSIEADSRCFVVAGATLYEVFSDGSTLARGTLSTTTGSVGMAWGTTQLLVTDGPFGYVLTLSSNVFAKITDADWPGSDRCDYIGGYFLLHPPGTQQIYVTQIDDATNIDALDFASAEASPDELIALIVVNQRVYLLGQTVTEVWYLSGGADFPLSRSNGETIDVGCIAPWSVCKADAGLMWVGRDLNGSGIVYRASGGPPQRISTTAVEEALQASSDLTQAVSYVYQDHGQTFYAINAPGVDSTWVYEVATNAWHERCDLDGDGQFIPHRVTHHVFSLNQHLVGDADGYVYRMDKTVNTFNGDARVCERISPNESIPLRERAVHREFVLDCITGEALSGTPQVTLAWSDDGGATYGNPLARSLGALGNRIQRVIWQRLGMARDRVWKMRFSDDAPFAIVSGESA